MDTPDLRYPIGKFKFPESISPADRTNCVQQISDAPALLKAAVTGLRDEQLNTAYRPHGWTVRQVVHHVPDSHLNSYIRYRWALTEDEPTIKAYDEARWAELYDARTAPVELSLALLESVHRRWVALLGALTEQDWKRSFRHPELGLLTLEKNAALYAWHGRHHAAHITGLRQRMGW